MKKIAFTLLIATLLISCKKDDDGDSGTSIEGTWKLTAFTTETGFDFNNDGTASTNLLAETNCYQNETLEFSSNGSGTATTRSYADITLDFVAGSTTEYEYTVNCIQETETSSFNWAQNGSNMVITATDFSYTGTISGATLTIIIPSGFVVEVEDGNGTAFTTEDITIVYTKQ
ncbi:MAG: hypothetical protein R2781_02215 [Flavobacteriaceae bacterium]